MHEATVPSSSSRHTTAEHAYGTDHEKCAVALAWMATISSTVTSDAKRASAERPSLSLTRRR